MQASNEQVICESPEFGVLNSNQLFSLLGNNVICESNVNWVQNVQTLTGSWVNWAAWNNALSSNDVYWSEVQSGLCGVVLTAISDLNSA